MDKRPAIYSAKPREPQSRRILRSCPERSTQASTVGRGGGRKKGQEEGEEKWKRGRGPVWTGDGEKQSIMAPLPIIAVSSTVWATFSPALALPLPLPCGHPPKAPAAYPPNCCWPKAMGSPLPS
ncbi:unnamed protein product [Prorocentrum cordatum]|uniref:Uncharacterized protein n=1 Tax=Prorocentrum cordatum TaxID=2364126 RepID=A0ABN9RSA7_9DINO|nr:unnamed protein product [Polarella glacialis]